MAVNSRAWQSFPVAPRNQPFNADQAIKRIQDAARGDVAVFNAGFLWRDDRGPATNKNSYRLPIADVIDGKFTLVPRAVFTAAAILQGAHGGLEGVVGDREKQQLRKVVERMYEALRDLYDDGRIVPPWQRADIPPDERNNRQIDTTTAALTASVNTSIASLPLTGVDRDWDGDGARARLWEWSGGDFRKYRRGFLWWDSAKPELKGSYKLPIADVIDGRLMIVPRAVNAVASVLGGGRGGVDIPESDATRIGGIVNRIQERFSNSGGEQASGRKDDKDDGPMTAAAPLRPPKEWFDDPGFTGPTRLTVDGNGRVRGHLALWNTCHMGIGDMCRMAPRSRTGYRYFADGRVLTADGSYVDVGRITVGTGHASLNLGYVPAADHYDNTGTTVAVTAAGEDRFGIWVAGATVPEATEVQVAALRRSPLSGDWRPTPHGLELVAALAVNCPGFPIVGYTDAGGQTLVAAGMVLSDVELDMLGVPVARQSLSQADENVLRRLEAFEAKAKDLATGAKKRRLKRILDMRGGE